MPCTARYPDTRPSVQAKCPTAQQVLLQALALRVEPRVTGQRVGSGRREDSLQGVRTPGNFFNPLKDACRKGAAGHK